MKWVGFWNAMDHLTGTFFVDSPESKFHGMLVVEYVSGSALLLLDPLLP